MNESDIRVDVDELGRGDNLVTATHAPSGIQTVSAIPRSELEIGKRAAIDLLAKLVEQWESHGQDTAGADGV
jgi:hypothetical protein